MKIESGIPIPEKASVGKNKGVIEAFKKLEVGGSIFLEGAKINCAHPYYSPAKSNTTKQFTARTVEGGIRIWRTV